MSMSSLFFFFFMNSMGKGSKEGKGKEGKKRGGRKERSQFHILVLLGLS